MPLEILVYDVIPARRNRGFIPQNVLGPKAGACDTRFRPVFPRLVASNVFLLAGFVVVLRKIAVALCAEFDGF